MDYLIAFVLGVVQGITEFLPVSSSAHLIIVSWIFKGKPLSITLNIALHLGTLMAVLLFFWRDWYKLIKNVLLGITARESSYEYKVLFPSLIIGSIPAGVIGLLWHSEIEALFHNPLTVTGPLIVVGVLIWWGDKKSRVTKKMEDLSILDAFLIGIAQACALIPGVSRSGSTILGARLLGCVREDAAKFSFMLGTPAMLGAFALESKNLWANIANAEFYIGCITSMIVGALTIKFFLGFLRRYGFGVFAIYRIIIAMVIIVKLAAF